MYNTLYIKPIASFELSHTSVIITYSVFYGESSSVLPLFLWCFVFGFKGWTNDENFKTGGMELLFAHLSDFGGYTWSRSFKNYVENHDISASNDPSR